MDGHDVDPAPALGGAAVIVAVQDLPGHAACLAMAIGGVLHGAEGARDFLQGVRVSLQHPVDVLQDDYAGGRPHHEEKNRMNHVAPRVTGSELLA
eukprot:5217008-Pyramimonas_sp.AAC.1